MNASESIPFFYPELILLLGSFLVIFLDFFLTNKKLLAGVTLLTLGLSAFAATAPAESYPLFSGFFRLDAFTHFFRYLALGIVAVTVLLSMAYRPFKRNEGEYYALFLFMTFGLILMASAANLLMIFLAIEFVSILSYLMVGYLKKDERSKEASIKYLLFGSVASGIMLFGMSLLFGGAESLDLNIIQTKLAGSTFFPLTMVASLLFLVGIGFKISMAPFHLWAADVYEGAPTPVTSFLTVAPKALGFAVLIRVFMMMHSWMGIHWTAVISGLAILTMTIGNLSALAQSNVKRLLAFSSVAQAGYILMGIAAATTTGINAVMIYLLAYAFTNLGAFTVVIIASNHLQDDSLSAYTGLAKRNPFIAASLTIFLLSLAGIPPLAGFIGKFYVFSAAIEAGLITLAVAAAINSAIAAFYYFKIVKAMYLTNSEDESPIPNTAPLWIALSLMLVGTVIVGIFPAPFISWIQSSVIL